MNANKTCFIHIRPNQQSTGTVASRGGFTLAWKINDAGDIVIGHPAICIGADHYVKRIGREIAERNLNTKPAIVTIGVAKITEYALSTVQHILHPKAPFTLVAKNEIMSKINDMVTKELLATMSSNWFELVVNTAFRFQGDDKECSLSFQGVDGAITTFRVKEPKPVVIVPEAEVVPVVAETEEVQAVDPGYASAV